MKKTEKKLKELDERALAQVSGGWGYYGYGGFQSGYAGTGWGGGGGWQFGIGYGFWY